MEFYNRYLIINVEDGICARKGSKSEKKPASETLRSWEIVDILSKDFASWHRTGPTKIGHSFGKYLRSGPVAHVLDGSSYSKPLLIQLGFVTNQQDFDSQEPNLQRTGFDSISGISGWIWNNTKMSKIKLFPAHWAMDYELLKKRWLNILSKFISRMPMECTRVSSWAK